LLQCSVGGQWKTGVLDARRRGMPFATVAPARRMKKRARAEFDPSAARPILFLCQRSD